MPDPFQTMVVVGFAALLIALVVVGVVLARMVKRGSTPTTPPAVASDSGPALPRASTPAPASVQPVSPEDATITTAETGRPGTADSVDRPDVAPGPTTSTVPLAVTPPDTAAVVTAASGAAFAAAEQAAIAKGMATAKVEAEAYRRRVESQINELRSRAERERSQTEDELQRRRQELSDQRLEVERREARLADREARLDTELHDLAQHQREVTEANAQLQVERSALGDDVRAQLQERERIAGLTAEQAKAELVAAVEHDAKRQAVVLARDIERQATRDASSRAREIVVGAIQRVASEQTSESVVSAVHLPGDEMKGRIIGREGRNIRAFEQVTGVNVMIDDTPESVLLSCFDPVRRETARLTLIELVKDGRIHPARIEEMHARSKSQVEQHCLRAAEDALAEVGISDLHPALVPVLGVLRYRTSYGQNVLKHLVESAHIAGLMAAELGLDVALCRRSAFLHDIGKALTHEVEGSHAAVGADLARKYGEHPDVVHAIEAHHGEVEPRTVEAVLTQAADAVSGSRPGARRESIESYVQRLERLEEIAGAHEGVDKVFAMQAGREIRVMVAPDVVDDIAAQVMARDIAKQVEEELTYPGQIKVTVVRESRATETAR